MVIRIKFFRFVLLYLFNFLTFRFHGHGPNEPVNYCMVCEEEVFNIFFVKEHEKKHVVHCLRCARQVSKDDFTNWICLGENWNKYLIQSSCLILSFFRGI